MEERKYSGKHKIILEKRQKVFITGIIDVMSFDEETVAAETDQGTLILRGHQLHVNSLNLEKGELEINGNIASLNYEDDSPLSKNRQSLFGKIFR